MTEACPLCSTPTFTKILDTKDYSLTGELFSIKECTTCHLKQTSPQPPIHEIGRYYNPEVYISHRDKSKSLVDTLYLIARKYALRWKVNEIKKQQKGINLLDYGCGTGEFLTYCKSVGYKVSGYEPSVEPRSIANQKSGEDIFDNPNQIPENAFDTITLWHVLEHVPNLNETLQLLKTRLKKNGTIFIAVPNHKSYDAEILKEYWAGYDVPRHLWHFEKNTMKAILAKNGLQINTIIPMKLDAYYISLVSYQYKMQQEQTNKKLKTLINSALLGFKSNRKAKSTNEYSSLIYVATNANA